MFIDTKRVKVSRRDAFLGLFGGVYVLLGYSFFIIPPIFKPILRMQLRFALDLMPIEAYGWLWIGCGVVAMLGALWRRFDGLGFAVATGMPLLWSAVNWTAQIQDGVPRAWVGGVLYGIIGAAVWLVSGMNDPRPRPAPHKRRPR